MSRSREFVRRWAEIWWWCWDVSLAGLLVWVPIHLGILPWRFLPAFGSALQIAGTVAVLLDLNHSPVGSGDRPILVRVRDFLGGIANIFRTPRIIEASMQIQVGAAMANGYGYVTHAASTGSVEDRLKNLETRMLEREKQAGELHNFAHKNVEELRTKLETEAKEREAGDSRVLDASKKAIIGELHLKVGGVAYLLVGIVVTAISSPT